MKSGSHPSSPTNNWSLPYGIVLAGGAGDRLRPVTEPWQGEHRPKQFCTFTGTRSMLQHTLDRVKTVVPHNNIFTVITTGLDRFLPDALNAAPPGRVLTQPSDRGTAAAVLLPLTMIYERDPDAAVMIFPCDHFVYPEGRFLEYVVATYRLCRRFRQSLVVLGAAPTSAETDYGWIMTEDPVGNGTSPLLQVGRFIEKPSPEEAKRMLRLGGFWSTMVVAARARTLWDLGWKVLPEHDAALRYACAACCTRFGPDWWIASRSRSPSSMSINGSNRPASRPTSCNARPIRRCSSRCRTSSGAIGVGPSASWRRSVNSVCARRRQRLRPRLRDDLRHGTAPETVGEALRTIVCGPRPLGEPPRIVWAQVE